MKPIKFTLNNDLVFDRHGILSCVSGQAGSAPDRVYVIIRNASTVLCAQEIHDAIAAAAEKSDGALRRCIAEHFKPDARIANTYGEIFKR